jgi:hypothetical protein
MSDRRNDNLVSGTPADRIGLVLTTDQRKCIPKFTMLNEDYRDMLHALSDEKVRLLLVSAYAMAAHGYPRATMDIDVWIMPSPQNADSALRALLRFGAPLHNLT